MLDWRVAGFTELGELGSGGQGRVVMARHDASGRVFAIKYLHLRNGDPASLAAFRAEARLLATVTSPNVVRLYDYVEHGEEGAGIVMEAVAGIDLRTALADHGPLTPEASLTVLKGSLLGLAAAHTLGIVHRDYKPGNVIVGDDGRSRLIDFGIAALSGERGHSGTPAYMAPEQWRGEPASPATDVYAATCVFFECVTGDQPYLATGTLAVKEQHLNAPVPAVRLPEPLRPLLERGMAKRPADRQADAAAFTAELEAIAGTAYGADWEQRGIRLLAEVTAALAALTPIAAALAPAATTTATAAGATTATTAATTAGASAAQVAGVSATTKVVIAGAAAVLAIGTGTVVTRQITASTPSRTTVKARAPAAAAAVGQDTTAQPCTVQAIDITAAPHPGKTRVRLPAQVTLPQGAAVYGGNWDQAPTGMPHYFLIGPAGGTCLYSQATADGNISHLVQLGSQSPVYESDTNPPGVTQAAACALFGTGTPEAAQVRQANQNCTAQAPDPTAAALPDLGNGRYAALGQGYSVGTPLNLRLVVLTLPTGTIQEILCRGPRTIAPICVAELTYFYAQQAGSGPEISQATARIRTYITRQ